MPLSDDLRRDETRLSGTGPPRARQMVATPDWPPVAIPGRPGIWRHCIDGQQVDLPTNTTTP